MLSFCWHKWSLWSPPIPTYDTGHKQQWRVCERCGKAEFRTLAWDKASRIENVHEAIKKVLKEQSK